MKGKNQGHWKIQKDKRLWKGQEFRKDENRKSTMGNRRTQKEMKLERLTTEGEKIRREFTKSKIKRRKTFKEGKGNEEK